MKTLTREEYLIECSKILAALFINKDYEIPNNVRFTCGLPSRGAFGKNKRTIGQCWDSSVSSDNTIEIMISPTIDNTLEVVGVLLHEMVHAVVGNEHGHKKPFKDCAIAVGLTGKMTATTNTAELDDFINNNIIESIGTYPHSKIDYTQQKKQTTRMIKASCQYCGYVIRTSLKWVEMGLPSCCCGGEFTIDNV